MIDRLDCFFIVDFRLKLRYLVFLTIIVGSRDIQDVWNNVYQVSKTPGNAVSELWKISIFSGVHIAPHLVIYRIKSPMRMWPSDGDPGGSCNAVTRRREQIKIRRIARVQRARFIGMGRRYVEKGSDFRGRWKGSQETLGLMATALYIDFNKVSFSPSLSFDVVVKYSQGIIEIDTVVVRFYSLSIILDSPERKCLFEDS